ncbi:MAG TPA: methyltransferase domain-containing protein [Gemmatimonadales bacterium]|nr:methyltransferase domain-containing protein [Gemmatimonadales bacterium]
MSGSAWRAKAFTALLLAALPAGAPAQGRAPADRFPDVAFVGTPMAVVTGMLTLAGVGEGDVVYDLGSGDGRIVIAAARLGARGVGIELDRSLVAESRAHADTAGVSGRVEFRQADIFETDLREATVVTLYLGRGLNERLRPILLRDLRPGSRVVSQAFDMGVWRPDSVVTVRGREFAATPVHLWIIPARVGGSWMLKLDEDVASGEQVGLTLTQRYQELAGTAGRGGSAVPLRDVRLRGDSLVFALGSRRFAGRVTDDEARGHIVGGTGTGSRWRAVRTRRR